MSSSVAIIEFKKYLGIYRVLAIYYLFKRFNVSTKSLLNLRVFNRVNPIRLTLSP